MDRTFLPIAGAFMVLSAFLSAGESPYSHLGQQSEPRIQVVEVTAKKYEFSPGDIRVKAGTTVQLRIRALDRTHGFKIELFPDGSDKKGEPGLRFSDPRESWKLEKNEERMIEFVAQRPGVYPFKCAVRCGFGHGRMKGQLVVEE